MRKNRDKNHTKKHPKAHLLVLFLLFRVHIKSLSFYSRETERESEQREILLLLLFFLSSTSERERERERECNKSGKRITQKSPGGGLGERLGKDAKKREEEG